MPWDAGDCHRALERPTLPQAALAPAHRLFFCLLVRCTKAKPATSASRKKKVPSHQPMAAAAPRTTWGRPTAAESVKGVDEGAGSAGVGSVARLLVWGLPLGP